MVPDVCQKMTNPNSIHKNVKKFNPWISAMKLKNLLLRMIIVALCSKSGHKSKGRHVPLGWCVRLPMRALQKTTTNHAPVSKGRKSVSVGSVCVLGEPWLELLADRVLLLLLLRQRNFSVPPETFLGAGIFCFLDRGQNSALSPQLADVFPKNWM